MVHCIQLLFMCLGTCKYSCIFYSSYSIFNWWLSAETWLTENQSKGCATICQHSGDLFLCYKFERMWSFPLRWVPLLVNTSRTFLVPHHCTSSCRFAWSSSCWSSCYAMSSPSCCCGLYCNSLPWWISPPFLLITDPPKVDPKRGSAEVSGGVLIFHSFSY